MSRSRQYAKRRVSTWIDKDFRALTLEQQGLYDALCAYPALSRCGVIPWIPNRLTICSDGLTVRKLTQLVKSLTETEFLRVDWDMAEVLIRSHIRHDDGLKTPNIARSIARAYSQIVSPYIQASVVTELARMYYEAPDLAGWAAIADEDDWLFGEVESHPINQGKG